MAKRCRHLWSVTEFYGNPVANTFSMTPVPCGVRELCARCKKDRVRTATKEEVDAQLAKYTCPSCGILNVDKETGNHVKCVSSLFETIRELTQRVADLENKLDDVENRIPIFR